MTTAETQAGVLPERAGIGFDGVLTSCVFGWDDQTRELVTEHSPDGTTP
jgi:myo-inositol catabolism protein IolH